MKVLVLGAGGFIGSHLVERLCRAGHEVVGVDTADEKLETRILTQIEFHCQDVRNYHEPLEKLIQASDLVMDLIAYANPAIYLERPLDVVQTNFFENLFVVESCVRWNKRLIQFSTCEVYGMSGGSTEPFSEESTPLIMGPIRMHRWIYACGKQFLERIIHAYGLERRLNYTILRPFNFIGPRMDYLIRDFSHGIPRVIPIFMSALIQGTTIYLVDGGRQKRAFTYIDDALDAIMIILDNRDRLFDRQICNIGNPDNEIDMADLARTMIGIFEELTGRVCPCRMQTITGLEFYGAGYQDCDRRIPDISKLTRCGWNPKTGLREALIRTMSSYLQSSQIEA
jgi:UDP-apiose/xylose synthase